MKCLEFVQMHGNGPVANRSAGDRISDNRVDMFWTGCRPGLGAGASGSLGAVPCSGCLREIMTGFRAAPKTKNRAMWTRLWGARLAKPDGVPTSGQLLVDESGQLRLAHGTHFGGRELAALEDHECGDAANAKLGGDVAVVIDVHLGDLQLAFVGAGHFVQDGGNHFAGAAPFGPEVHHHRLAGLEDVGFEGGVGGVFDQIAGHGLFLVNIEMRLKLRLF